jgi:crotonobetainyl-CoA:carnitine CoA-transferase CaiB-like acyl-CoA transferase
MTLPLQRLKVLDLSQIMAGPFRCMLLGDMGAVVMDIEHPAEGTIKSLGFP